MVRTPIWVKVDVCLIVKFNCQRRRGHDPRYGLRVGVAPPLVLALLCLYFKFLIF